jgi:ribonuclease P protein component
MSFRFPKHARLLTTAQFDRVFALRASASDQRLVVYAARNDVGIPRLGLVVSRKCGNAVVRNRWKRCLREAFRLAQHDLPPDLDLVVLPRSGSTPLTTELRVSLAALARRAERKLPPIEGESP